MRILFVSSEVAPFAKTGGLADVAAALPKTLSEMGHEVRIVMPAYDMVRRGGHEPRAVDPGMIGFDLGPNKVVADVLGLDLDSVPISLLSVPGLYHRGDLYSDDPDEALRFATLCRGALELCLRWGWAPDVIHCNDWQTGLIPLYLRTIFAGEHLFRDVRTVLTIHNLAYQGVFGADQVDAVGLGDHARFLHRDHLGDGWFGFLETGLLYADALTTVSPTYAREILTSEYGYGLDGLLRHRSGDLFGILNGIDTAVWSPTTDHKIAHRYSDKSLWRKEWNKRDLLEGLGLDYTENVPVIGIISRMVGQKGIGLLPRPLSGILENTDARFIALGSGEPHLEAGLDWLADRFPTQVRYVRGYDEPLSHRIEAGADLYLMPSQFEPCGLNQMYSLAYGTPPLVRRTGGLADTVEHWNPHQRTGTGFVFEHYDEGGVWWALNQAMEAMGDRTAWKEIQLNGMSVDNSWQRSATEYESLYLDLAGGSQ